MTVTQPPPATETVAPGTLSGRPANAPGPSARVGHPADRPTSRHGATTTGVGERRAARYVWAVTRLSLSFVFLWAFVDKLFGLGKATESANSWVSGGSPTTGFLSGVAGPFAGIFNRLAGAAWADWLFMTALLAIGVALGLGIGMRIAAISGGVLLGFMWAASLPIANNPVIDDHLVYALVLGGLALSHAGDTLGFGRWWGQVAAVKRFPALV